MPAKGGVQVDVPLRKQKDEVQGVDRTEFTRISHGKVPCMVFGKPHMPNVHAKPVKMGFSERPRHAVKFDGGVRVLVFRDLVNEFDSVPKLGFVVVGLSPFLENIGLLFLVPQPIANGCMVSQTPSPVEVDVVPVLVFSILGPPGIEGITDVCGHLELLVNFAVSAQIEQGVIEAQAIFVGAQLVLEVDFPSRGHPLLYFDPQPHPSIPRYHHFLGPSCEVGDHQASRETPLRRGNG